MPTRRVSLTRRTAVVLAAVLSGSFAIGCYVYEPVTSSMIAPGKTIAVDLNDLGRLSLASLIGPEVKRISGVLVSQSNSEYVIRVTQLGFFNGKESEWSGEAVTVRNDYVSTLYQEKLSSSKTALAFAGGLGAAGALLAARNLIVNGSSSDEGKPGGGGGGQTSRGIQ
jgi:hypothetical protein